MRGPLPERRPARLPPLAGHGEALWRSPGPLRVGDALRHRHSLHLHRGTRHHVGTGKKDANGGSLNEFCFSSALTLSFLLSGGVFPLPVSERLHGAASLHGLGAHGRDRDQRLAHHHHQRLRSRHKPRDARPGCAGK